MRICTLLNKDGGSLKTMDLSAFSEEIISVFAQAGHETDVKIVAGDELEAALEEIANNYACDVLLAGGGDGTISAAAHICRQTQKPLAVLPAGTMNLFARTLGLPLNLNDALKALAEGEESAVDVGTVNGQLFLHQLSIGLHPKIVKLRDRQDHQSRFQKIFGSVRAALAIFSRSPHYQFDLAIDGQTSNEDLSLIAVSNNRYGRGHMPYADFPSQGELGIYSAKKLPTQANLKLASDMLLGTWDTNPDLLERSGKKVTISMQNNKKLPAATLDGEMLPPTEIFDIEIHPKALKVIAPKPQQNEGLFGF